MRIEAQHKGRENKAVNGQSGRSQVIDVNGQSQWLAGLVQLINQATTHFSTPRQVTRVQQRGSANTSEIDGSLALRSADSSSSSSLCLVC